MKLYTRFNSRGSLCGKETTTILGIVLPFILSLFFAFLTLYAFQVDTGWRCFFAVLGSGFATVCCLIVFFSNLSLAFIHDRVEEITPRRRGKIAWTLVFCLSGTAALGMGWQLWRYHVAEDTFRGQIAQYCARWEPVYFQNALRARQLTWSLWNKELDREHTWEGFERAFKAAFKKSDVTIMELIIAEHPYRGNAEKMRWKTNVVKLTRDDPPEVIHVTHDEYSMADIPRAQRFSEALRIAYEASYSPIIAEEPTGQLLQIWYEQCFEDGKTCQGDTLSFQLRVALAAGKRGDSYGDKIAQEIAERLRAQGNDHGADNVLAYYRQLSGGPVWARSRSLRGEFPAEWGIPAEY